MRPFHDLATELRRVARAETQVHGRLRRHLITIVTVTIGIDLVCACIAYALEQGAKGSQIKTFGSALFWTTTQLLTVSSQLPNPITTGARFLDVFMQIWAVSIIASLAGAVGTFLVKRA